MRVLLVTCVLLASAHARAQLVSAHARAQIDDEPPRVLASVSTGAGLALSSLAAGGVLLATEDSNRGRKVGALTMVSGLALSPIVSHAIAGEWGRAALFGAVPVAAAVGTTIMIESAPTLLGHGTLQQRRVLTLCYCLDLFGAAVGLFDSMSAGERARPRTFALAPWFDRAGLGLGVGGWL